MKVQKLTPEAFAEFGDIITTEGAHSFPINDGTTERFHDLAQIELADAQGKPLVSLFLGRPRQ
jgi:ureidoglycolate lyase